MGLMATGMVVVGLEENGCSLVRHQRASMTALKILLLFVAIGLTVLEIKHNVWVTGSYVS